MEIEEKTEPCLTLKDTSIRQNIESDDVPMEDEVPLGDDEVSYNRLFPSDDEHSDEDCISDDDSKCSSEASNTIINVSFGIAAEIRKWAI